MTTTPLPPLSLYIHIPWCIRKCPYCDFNSHQAGQQLPEADYVKRLVEDLHREQYLIQGRRLHSIFIGGGTPSLFSAAAIGKLLQQIEQYIGFEPQIEITLEANPGTFEQAKFSDFRAAGINRLSIGIQSFNDLQLQKLGRVHSSDEAQKAIAVARNAGFDNINLDLMHGLPAQSLAAALDDLRLALTLAPEHLSWYQLTIEPNTQFYSHPPVLPPEDTLADIQDQGHELLTVAGYRQYEVSAYARAERQSRHNRNYWEFGDYLGIGAGAHGKITQVAHGQLQVVRRWKTRHPNHYLDPNRNLLAGEEVIGTDKLRLEFLMNALRLTEGVASSLFTARTGLALERLQPQWQQLQNRELLIAGEQRLQATPTGQRFLNSVLGGFLDK